MPRIYVRINANGVSAHEAEVLIGEFRERFPAARKFSFEESEGPRDEATDNYVISVPAESEDEAVATIVGLLGLARVVPQEEAEEDALWRIRRATERGDDQ